MSSAMLTSSSTTRTRSGEPSGRVRSAAGATGTGPAWPGSLWVRCELAARKLSAGPPNRIGPSSVTPVERVAKQPSERRVGGTRDDGFTAYVAGRRAHLYRTAYLLCGDPHRAEDIVQNALAKLYVAWPRASRADSVDAYVRRVIINSHLDEHRRPWRREAPTEDE